MTTPTLDRQIRHLDFLPPKQDIAAVTHSLSMSSSSSSVASSSDLNSCFSSAIGHTFSSGTSATEPELETPLDSPCCEIKVQFGGFSFHPENLTSLSLTQPRNNSLGHAPPSSPRQRGPKGEKIVGDRMRSLIEDHESDSEADTEGEHPKARLLGARSAGTHRGAAKARKSYGALAPRPTQIRLPSMIQARSNSLKSEAKTTPISAISSRNVNLAAKRPASIGLGLSINMPSHGIKLPPPSPGVTHSTTPISPISPISPVNTPTQPHTRKLLSSRARAPSERISALISSDMSVCDAEHPMLLPPKPRLRPVSNPLGFRDKTLAKEIDALPVLDAPSSSPPSSSRRSASVGPPLLLTKSARRPLQVSDLLFGSPTTTKHRTHQPIPTSLPNKKAPLSLHIPLSSASLSQARRASNPFLLESPDKTSPVAHSTTPWASGDEEDDDISDIEHRMDFDDRDRNQPANDRSEISDDEDEGVDPELGRGRRQNFYWVW
ncbi:hypothetical protein SISSUDRAFT_1046425 [Sistotremastrum suecicum HHB10207 ss-3]|uniref:Uncharacterized protein n=1 Tax=Sistotremastrum suecicum HHB10207 ss-3 TaxID=1314776 RepID=A0A166DRQ5_9AGAM|nr:hypothetical protein SISSUDRAFT_1046425 [Sistotremastrum suecicum HHB10207 ss-3]